ELTEYGFDHEKASNWTGADYDPETNSLINITSEIVTYEYDIGNEMTAEFSLSFGLEDLTAYEGNEMVALRWDEYQGAEKYSVTYTDGITEQTVSDITRTTCFVRGLSNYKEYTFKVKAYANGKWSMESTVYAIPSDTVAINEKNFPDDNFRQLVSDYFDADGDGFLSAEEAAAVIFIDVHNMAVSDLTGIWHFTAMDSLDCGYNEYLTQLDVSNNTALVALYCYNTAITELDLSNNTSIKFLNCSDTDITELDVSNNTALAELICDDTAISELDVSNNTSIEFLDCSDTYITELDVSNITTLRILRCNNTYITALDLSNNTALEDLQCNNTDITSLDLSNNTALTELQCNETQLTSIDVSHLSLEEFQCEGNVYCLSDICLDELVGYGFDPAKASNWTNAEYDAETNSLKNRTSNSITYTYDAGDGHNVEFQLVIAVADAYADVCENIAYLSWTEFPSAEHYRVVCKDTINSELVYAEYETEDCYFNFDGLIPEVEFYFYISAYIDGSWTETAEVTAMWSELSIDESSFPDEAFRQWVLDNADTNDDEYLSVGEAEVIEEIDVQSNGITSLEGIRYFSELAKLDCYCNELESLDLTGMARLTTLHCEANKLDQLILNGAISLEEIYCYQNQFSTLDVRDLGLLKVLECYENCLTELHVDGLSTLTKLVCNSNELYELDLSGLTSLEELKCHDNRLSVLELDGLASLKLLHCYSNELVSLDISDTAISSIDDIKCYYNYYRLSVAELDELSEYGFDHTKASNWTGAEYNSDDNCLTNFTSNNVTYSYDVGKGISCPFTLSYTRPMFIETEARDGKVTFSWDAVDGAERYSLSIYDPETGKYTLRSSKITRTTYTASALTNGEEYVFLIRAYVNGEWSPYTSEDFIKATPTA
ncbi:MAG: hypothetical protein IJO91_10410, partial [Oscillospiraceae bacterium]|nr:hypothetical protein [Oscillospiraceae bacterium]